MSEVKEDEDVVLEELEKTLSTINEKIELLKQKKRKNQQQHEESSTNNVDDNETKKRKEEENKIEKPTPLAAIDLNAHDDDLDEDEDDESSYVRHYSRSSERERNENSSGTSTRDENEPPIEYAIYVSDIARGVTDKQLKDGFAVCGKVYEATVVKNRYTGETKGYGFVRFYTMDDVHRALDMEKLPKFEDQITHQRRHVKVKLADPKNAIYVGAIPKHLSEEEVKKQLSEIGEVPIIKFELSLTDEGKSKGFGWATYKDHEEALAALQRIQKSTIENVPVMASLAQPRVVDDRVLSKVKTLFVKNVGPNVTEQDILALFSTLGQGVVEHVVIPVDQTKKTRLGHAFVYFTERKDAEAARVKFEGAELDGRRINIEWCRPKATKQRTPNQHSFRGKSPAAPGHSRGFEYDARYMDPAYGQMWGAPAQSGWGGYPGYGAAPPAAYGSYYGAYGAPPGPYGHYPGYTVPPPAPHGSRASHGYGKPNYGGHSNRGNRGGHNNHPHPPRHH